MASSTLTDVRPMRFATCAGMENTASLAPAAQFVAFLPALALRGAKESLLMALRTTSAAFSSSGPSLSSTLTPSDNGRNPLLQRTGPEAGPGEPTTSPTSLHPQRGDFAQAPGLRAGPEGGGVEFPAFGEH